MVFKKKDKRGLFLRRKPLNGVGPIVGGHQQEGGLLSEEGYFSYSNSYSRKDLFCCSKIKSKVAALPVTFIFFLFYYFPLLFLYVRSLNLGVPLSSLLPFWVPYFPLVYPLEQRPLRKLALQPRGKVFGQQGTRRQELLLARRAFCTLYSSNSETCFMAFPLLIPNIFIL